MSITKEQRFSKKNRCPICGGCDQDPRGEKKRCTGYISSQGKHVLCSREEHSGSLSANDAGLYVHRRFGECDCGAVHSDDPEIEAVYDYCDEAGALLFQVIRKTGKRFLQRRPVAGGWEWKTAGMQMVLYRLPELIAARNGEDPIIFVCEGEKDVEAARRVGLVATCNPRGAGKWKGVEASARTVLAGADVVVIQDNDAPGEAHARAVCDDLVEYAAHVRWLKPPVGKDLADWIGTGASAERILDACKSATSVRASRAEMVALHAPALGSGEAMGEYAESGQDWIDDEAHPSPDDEPPHYRVAPRIDDDDPRPEIRISLELHKVVGETIEALAGMRVNGSAEPHGIGDPRMFVRAERLVSVARYEPPPDREDCIPKGQPVIYEVQPPTLVMRLSQYALFYRMHQPSDAEKKAAAKFGTKIPEEWKRCLAPPNIVNAVIHAKEYPGMRRLVGVSESPMLRPDGTIARADPTRATYDWTTGYLFVPGLKLPTIPDEPTQADARKALRALEEPFCDFPHVSPEHKMVPIAAILTLLARAAIGGAVPAFVFDAAIRGAGKTRQVDVISWIALGRGAARKTYPEKEEELEKVLCAVAMHGSPLLLLDNVTRTFGGGQLDACLTADGDIELRKLGSLDWWRGPWRTIVCASGNNIVCSEDTMRRVMISRIEPETDDPESRTDFKHPDLIPWVKSERARLVAAALTILRAYCVVDRPDAGCPVWGSFEEWSRLIPHAIRFAGGADPMGARPRGEGAVTEDMRALSAIVDLLPRLDAAGHGLTTKEIIRLLYPSNISDDERSTDGFDDLREAIETLAPPRGHANPSSQFLGKRFQRYRARPINGRRLLPMNPEDTKANRAQRWAVR